MLKNIGSQSLAAPLLLVFVAACNHTAARRQATAESPPSAASPASASAAAAPVPTVPDAGTTRWRFAFSAADSRLEFTGVSAKGKHHGSFTRFNGTILVLNGSPEQSSVTVDVDLGSVQTDDAKLTRWLKSPAFFDVAKFPKARFVSSSVRPGGDLAATNTVTGILDLHGASQSLDIPGTLHVRPDAVDVDAELPLARAAFGLTDPGKPHDLLDDAVVLNLVVTAQRVPEP
jgi:polyisoprenoid-binding protein YceI